MHSDDSPKSKLETISDDSEAIFLRGIKVTPQQ